MAVHFHVCEECFTVWGHNPESVRTKSTCWPHDCPKCDTGPYLEGFGSRRQADEEAVRLKTVVEK